MAIDVPIASEAGSTAPPRKPLPVTSMLPLSCRVVAACTATTPPTVPSHPGAVIEPTPVMVNVPYCGTRMTWALPAAVIGFLPITTQRDGVSRNGCDPSKFVVAGGVVGDGSVNCAVGGSDVRALHLDDEHQIPDSQRRPAARGEITNSVDGHLVGVGGACQGGIPIDDGVGRIHRAIAIFAHQGLPDASSLTPFPLATCSPRPQEAGPVPAPRPVANHVSHSSASWCHLRSFLGSSCLGS